MWDVDRCILECCETGVSPLPLTTRGREYCEDPIFVGD
jgi:hypothetical protein